MTPAVTTYMHAGDRYVEQTVRLNRATMIGAALITLLTIAASSHSARAVAIIVGVQIVLIGFNTWVNLVFMRRHGVRRSEILRTFANMFGTILIAQFAGFPVAIWLWLPFVALTFDHFGRRAAIAILLVLTAQLDALAFLDGVPWIYPVMFTAFALFCLLFSRARFDTIREMLTQADEHRVELERAHAATRRAHEKLLEETCVREQVEIELRQAQKLEAIGRLAAGIAHEINTPVQFVSHGAEFLGGAVSDIFSLIETFQALRASAERGADMCGIIEAAKHAEEAADLPFLRAEMPRAVEQMKEGLDRIAVIVRSMREFAHPAQKVAAPLDINRALRSTLAISEHEYKLVADVDLDLGDIPEVTCMGGEMNQVFLNIIVNAAHAIAEAVGDTNQKGRITVRTRVIDGDVLISIADTGTGIPESIRERIFEPFFTTKGVGRGTGQGLAIARSVVAAHYGALTFASEVGRGTTFEIRLPALLTRATTIAA